MLTHSLERIFNPMRHTDVMLDLRKDGSMHSKQIITLDFAKDVMHLAIPNKIFCLLCSTLARNAIYLAEFSS